MSGEKVSKSRIVTEAGNWLVLEDQDEIRKRMKETRRNLVAATLDNGIKVNFCATSITDVKKA